jgi:DNA-binding MltR family transcriptional regulator
MGEDAMVGEVMAADYRAIIEEIEKQTDRGAAIIGAALVDDVLARAILGKFISLSSTKKKALFGGSGPLGTYQAKIDLAYALGLLTDAMATDFKLIGSVRNKFAHRPTAIGFSDKDIADLCSNLKTGQIDKEEDWVKEPRNMYIAACTTLVAVLTLIEVDRIDEETMVLERSLAERLEPK